LDAHCKEVDYLLAGGGAMGKELGFVVQAFSREANTLGSKMVTEDFQNASIELKGLIEQMREQVQNLARCGCTRLRAVAKLVFPAQAAIQAVRRLFGALASSAALPRFPPAHA
jgi:hypothetical protein